MPTLQSLKPCANARSLVSIRQCGFRREEVIHMCEMAIGRRADDRQLERASNAYAHDLDVFTPCRMFELSAVQTLLDCEGEPLEVAQWRITSAKGRVVGEGALSLREKSSCSS